MLHGGADVAWLLVGAFWQCRCRCGLHTLDVLFQFQAVCVLQPVYCAQIIHTAYCAGSRGAALSACAQLQHPCQQGYTDAA
jgi:hypothetical protein